MKQNNTDSYWMKKAAELAKNGLGFTSPNPIVGAVIVRDGFQIGAGWHKKCGGPHAEIEAIRSVSDPQDLKGAAIYVTLEPCSTHGRTPPCCDAIIANGFSRVVIGCTDPNPAHKGRAVDLLRSRKIEVTTDVEQELCQSLNKAFFKWICTKRPYVILKMAETLDGKTATYSGDSKWVTSDIARQRVAHLRLWADAVMAGTGTFQLDSPRFTARDDSGNILKTPRRIIVSNHPEKLVLPDSTWETVSLKTPSDWNAFLEKTGAEQVTSILLEGGGELASSALAAQAVDEIEFHIAPKILGGRDSHTAVDGENPLLMSNALKLKNMTITPLGSDFQVNAIPDYDSSGKE